MNSTTKLIRGNQLTKLISSSLKPQTSQYSTNAQIEQWNQLVVEAENLMGYSLTKSSLGPLMNDASASMVTHMQKLMDSGHPILNSLNKVTKREGYNAQIRGLIVLLIARGLNSKSVEQITDYEKEYKVLNRQRNLAQYVDMIYTGQNIHQTLVDMPHGFHEQPESDSKTALLKLEYGNKMAILGGDHLLANACTGLASLRNAYIVEIVSLAISDFTQSEFLGPKDNQGRFLPTDEQLSLESWIHRNTLAHGNLMAGGCKGAMMLAELDDELQEKCKNLGTNISLALQSFTELKNFTREGTDPSILFDLSAAPVLFRLQDDAELLKYIQSCGENLETLNYKQVFDTVKSGTGIEKTQELCQSFTKNVENDLNLLNDDKSKDILLSVINHFKEC